MARGTPRYRRANATLFIAGFATFTLLYCVQPLLPLFATSFAVAPASASLILSVTSGALALGLLATGPVSEARGRKNVMTWSLASAAALNLLAGLAPNLPALLVLRGLEGFALAGLPAVAMAYLGEEFEPGSLGAAMGLYVAGTGLGGMLGRLITGTVADAVGWHWALAINGLLGLVAALAFARALPPSANFRPVVASAGAYARAYRSHLRDAGLPWLYAVGFCTMGAFVTVYNYVSFRLAAPPYALSQTAISLVFVVYLGGVAASTYAGELADRFGRRRLLWVAVAVELAGILLTLARPLPAVVAGTALLTVGFFAAHSIASSWIGRRASTARAQASALYLFFYYLGATSIGTLGGLLYAHGGWSELVAGLATLMALDLAAALRLRGLAPIATASPPNRLPA